MGHSPVSLPVLLSEVLMSMCPPTDTPMVLQAYAGNNMKKRTDLSNTNHNNNDTTINDNDQSTAISPTTTQESKKIHVGVVSGSFDGIAGRIIVSLLESIEPSRRASLILTVMCFPTSRDGKMNLQQPTDILNHLSIHTIFPSTLSYPTNILIYLLILPSTLTFLILLISSSSC